MEERAGGTSDCLLVLLKWNVWFAGTCLSGFWVAGTLTNAGPFQKGVMISHRNVISNVLQISTFEKPYRDSLMDMGLQSPYTDVALGLLPQSHIYALVVICHATTYRGDQVINLPKFELRQYLEAIQRFKINTLYLVSLQRSPPSIFRRIPKSYEPPMMCIP